MAGWKDRVRGLLGGRGLGTAQPAGETLDPDLCLTVSSDVSPAERAAYCTRLIQSGDPSMRARFHNSRGNAYRDLDRRQEALKDYNRAIELDGSNDNFFCNRAVAANELGHPDVALADLNHVIERNPDHTRSRAERADLFCDVGREEEALLDIDHALALEEPTDYRLWLRGQILMQLARYPEAIDTLSTAIEREPDDVANLERRATCYNMLDQRELAIADLERALAIDPQSRRVHGGLGSAYTDIDPKRALRHLNIAVELDPDNSPGFNNRSVVHARLGNNEAAEADLDRAVAISPHDPTFRHNRAINRLEAGRFAEAEADLLHIAEVHPGDPVTATLLARLALIQGDVVRARALLASVLDPYPNFGDAVCVTGWVELAEHRIAEARKAFDHVLAQPRGSYSGRQSERVRWTALYGRGLARQQAGEVSAGEDDMAEARAIRSDADRIVAAWSVRPAGSGSTAH